MTPRTALYYVRLAGPCRWRPLSSNVGRHMPRIAISNSVRIAVLTEAGYRCAAPTCRTILAIDMHHLVPVSENGGNTIANLIALCPTCHALFHRGEISRDSIYTWKSLLTSLSQAFDQRDIDDLLFLDTPQPYRLEVSGDGVVKFSRLIGAGLATYGVAVHDHSGGTLRYRLSLTDRGARLVHAWKSGDRAALAKAQGGA